MLSPDLAPRAELSSTSAERLRFGVLGAGGMGSAFAAALTAAAYDVVLIGRGGEHVTAVAERGLQIRAGDSPPTEIEIVTHTSASTLEPDSLDVLIVLTKTFDSAVALGSARAALAPTGVAVSLQNGLGNDQVLASVVGSHRALIGLTTVGATVESPGLISLSGITSSGGSLTQLGSTELAGGGARAEAIVAALCGSNLPTVLEPDIGPPIWEKLAMAVVSPISAVLGYRIGQVWGDPEGRKLVRAMFEEVLLVAEREGVQVDGERAWAHTGRTLTGGANHFTSMCVDVMNGRPTELDAMSREVVRRAHGHGVDVPRHDTVLALLEVLKVR